MYKKALIGSVAIVIGFLLRDFKAGEEIFLVESLLMFAGAFALAIFVEWTFIPYDWNKHKNKDKEKKNLT